MLACTDARSFLPDHQVAPSRRPDQVFALQPLRHGYRNHIKQTQYGAAVSCQFEVIDSGQGAVGRSRRQVVRRLPVEERPWATSFRWKTR